MQNQEKILLTINEFCVGRRIMIHRKAADKWLADCAAHQDNCLPSLH